MNTRIQVLVLQIALACATTAAFAAPQPQEGAPSAEPSKSLYWQGHEALGRKDWDAALGHFRDLEQQLAGRTSEPVDAAIYWQAYALVQAKRAREAATAIERLRRAHPQSAWIDDAQALSSRIANELDPKSGGEGASRKAPGGDTRDPREADALMALDALLSGGNEKAVPLLQRVLTGDHSDRVKGRAIFVLTQIDANAAEAALDAVLTGDASPKLKSEAIRMIAAGGRPESLDRLLPLYRSSADAAVRRGVLDAFLIGDRADLMLQVAQGDGDARSRRDAIQKLGAMGRDEELARLYVNLTDPKERRSVMQALGVAGAHGRLIELARGEKDVRVRAEAIRAIGIAGGKDAPAALLDFYAPDQPDDVRKAVIDALMIAGDTMKLVQLYRAETDPDLRRTLLQRITSSDPDAALDLIDKALQR
jgi:HEAT repeat protein